MGGLRGIKYVLCPSNRSNGRGGAGLFEMLRPVVYTPEGRCYGTYETNHSGCGQPPAGVHICSDKLVERDRAVLVLQTTRKP